MNIGLQFKSTSGNNSLAGVRGSGAVASEAARPAGQPELLGPHPVFQESVRQFLLALETLRDQSDPVLRNLARIQEDAQPLKSHAQSLANSLRDHIFAALSFCTSHDEYIPSPCVEFEHFFLRSDLSEFMSKQESLAADIRASFARAIQRCLAMAARYQSVRPQSLKSNKLFLDMVTFPHFCDIKEDVNDLHENLKAAKSLVDDLYQLYFKLMEAAAYLSERCDPVSDLENIAFQMREQVGECERLFVKKTSYFMKLYNRLDAGEKEEFARQLFKEKPIDEGEEDEEEDMFGDDIEKD
jgi:hypothetical protein